MQRIMNNSLGIFTNPTEVLKSISHTISEIILSIRKILFHAFIAYEWFYEQDCIYKVL